MVYRLYWTPTEMYFSIQDADTGYEYRLDVPEISIAENDTLDLIFKLFVGGDIMGIQGVDDVTAPFPAQMYVDYVRVYEYNGEGTVFIEGNEIESKRLITSDTYESVLNNQGYKSAYVFNTVATDEKFEIRVQDATKLEQITIFSTIGQQLYTQDSFESALIKLDVDRFPKGIYLINLLFTDGTREFSKVVVP